MTAPCCGFRPGCRGAGANAPPECGAAKPVAVAAKRRGCSGYEGVTLGQKWRNKLVAEWGSSEIRAASKRVASVAKLLGRLTENDCHCRRRRFCWTFRPLGNRTALHPEPARECDSAGGGCDAAGGAGAAGRRLGRQCPASRPGDANTPAWSRNTDRTAKRRGLLPGVLPYPAPAQCRRA